MAIVTKCHALLTKKREIGENEIDDLWSKTDPSTRLDMCRDSFSIGARMAGSLILENVEVARESGEKRS
jgi:hypothetical protein